MRILTLIVACFLAVTATFAQGDRGTITGTVSDPAGAVVPGTPVIARNIDTGAQSQTVTTGTGNFTLTSLPAGTYEVSVSAPGFSKYVQKGITVQVAMTARLDVTLQVGSTTDTVTVTADVALLRTEGAEQSFNITGDRINNLPINFSVIAGGYVRSPFAFVGMMPGANVTGQNNIRVNGFGGNSGNGAVPIGVRFEGQESANSNSGARADELQPSVEAVQEFTLQTSNYSAEYGQVGGGMFNFTARSGSNRYHGSAYEYFANEALNAGIPFSNDGSGHLIRPRSRKHDFGFSAGGPLSIPKIYNGKDRTFFFANIEFYRDKKISSGSYQTIPTDAYRAGNFATALTGRNLGNDQLGRPMLENTIYDPTTRRQQNGVFVTDPFAGNIIPQARFDPIAAKIQNLIPKATRAGLVNNWEQVYPFDKVQDVPSIKIDHTFTAKQKMSFYLGRFRTDQYVNPDGLPEPLTQLRILLIRSKTVRVNYDYTVTPTVLLHLGAGFIEYRNPETGVPGSVDYDSRATLGLNAGFLTPSGFPRIQGLNQNQGGTNLNLGPSHAGLYINDKPTAVASVTYIRNNHTYKLGGDWRNDIWASRSRWNTFGQFTFGVNQTGLPSTESLTLPGGTALGFPYASFLLGLANNAGIGSTYEPQFQKHSLSLFVQDTWKVTRRLTLDYGIRWDRQEPPREIHGRMAGFSPTTSNPSAGGLLGGTAYEGEGAGRCNCRFANVYPFAIGPRIGAAYQIDSKTVVRAGWGFTYSVTPQFGYLASTLGVGWNTLTFDTAARGLPGAVLAEGLKYSIADLYRASYDPGIRPQAGLVNSPGSLVDPNGGRPPRINQWNISLQREITKDLAVEAAYVASRGVWITSNNMTAFNALTPDRLRSFGLDINNAADRTLLRSRFDSAGVQARGFRAPYAAFPAALPLAQALRPYPQFSDLGPMWAPLGNSWYDALQAKVTQRYSRGLDFTVSFTWQKEQVTGDSINDVFNRPNQKSLSSQSQPLVLAAGFSYEMPKLTSNKIVRQIVGGWSWNGMIRYASGQPIAVPSSNNNLSTLLFRGTRMNRVAGEPLYLVDSINSNSFDPTTTFVLNPKAWANPAEGQWGTAAPFYNDYRTRRQPSETLSLGRIFRFRGERGMSLQIRAEFFNIFNRNVYPGLSGNNPSTTPTRSASGATTNGFGFYNTANAVSTQTGGTIPNSRNGQLVARFQW